VDVVENEPLFADRVAGIDIGKAEVVAAVRVPGPGRRRMQEVRSFPATRRGLDELADWLEGHGVTRAGMESTGDYWKPVFFTLERRGFECLLYNSRQVKAQPGRPKTDLLTELPAAVGQVGGRAGAGVANVARRDHWRRWPAGLVPSCGAAGGVA
jgi:transposase